VLQARSTLQSGPLNNYARFIHSVGWFAIIAIFSGPVIAQVPVRQPESSACRKFVQEFYDWYQPLMQKRAQQPAWNLALQRKPEAFNSDLLKALKIDSEASAHAKGDIVGLDFDPFVGGQDPAGHYQARGVSWQGERCSVEVWPASPAPKSGKPDAIAEVVLASGNWEFQNFRYPESNSNLVSVLAELRAERQKH
jgi:hypothetical protein